MRLVVSIIIFAICLKSCARRSEVPKNAGLEVIAKVSIVKNDVKRRRYQNIEWNSVSINEDLFQKDYIRTMSDSSASVTFHDLSELKVRENSLVIIERPKEIIKRVDTKITLKEGTLNRSFKTKKNREYVSEISTDRLVTYISSKKANVGIKYKKNKKLKIAVYSGQTKIDTYVKPKKKKNEELKKDKAASIEEGAFEVEGAEDDLLEVAVYEGGADVNLNVVDEKTQKSETKQIVIKKNEFIQIDKDVKAKTLEPLKNLAKVDILKEEIITVPEEKKKPEKQLKKMPKKKKSAQLKYKKSKTSKIILKWEKIKNAEKYLIDISDSRYFMNILETKFTKKNNLKIEIKTLRPGTYYWQVAPIIGGEIREYRPYKKIVIEK